MDMEHYEDRVKIVVGREGYRTVLEILTGAWVREGVKTTRRRASLLQFLLLEPSGDESRFATGVCPSALSQKYVDIGKPIHPGSRRCLRSPYTLGTTRSGAL